MRRSIERLVNVWPDGTPVDVLRPGDPIPDVKVEEWEEPIRIDNSTGADILIQVSLLVLRNYPDGNVKEGFAPLFCPKCGTLRGVGNSYEIILGEMHEDGRLTGRGAKLPIKDGVPLTVECDEPDCGGNIVWPPERLEWSDWDYPSQIAKQLGIDPRTFRRYRERGHIRSESKPGTKLVRIVKNNLPLDWEKK